jgi:hypothetical protein
VFFFIFGSFAEINPSAKIPCDKKDDKMLKPNNGGTTHNHLILKSAICNAFNLLPISVRITS